MLFTRSSPLDGLLLVPGGHLNLPAVVVPTCSGFVGSDSSDDAGRRPAPSPPLDRTGQGLTTERARSRLLCWAHALDPRFLRGPGLGQHVVSSAGPFGYPRHSHIDGRPSSGQPLCVPKPSETNPACMDPTP